MQQPGAKRLVQYLQIQNCVAEMSKLRRTLSYLTQKASIAFKNKSEMLCRKLSMEGPKLQILIDKKIKRTLTSPYIVPAWPAHAADCAAWRQFRSTCRSAPLAAKANETDYLQHTAAAIQAPSTQHEHP